MTPPTASKPCCQVPCRFSLLKPNTYAEEFTPEELKTLVLRMPAIIQLTSSTFSYPFMHFASEFGGGEHNYLCTVQCSVHKGGTIYEKFMLCQIVIQNFTLKCCFVTWQRAKKIIIVILKHNNKDVFKPPQAVNAHS